MLYDFLFCILWLFAFGSAFGSFLNVVVWRLPQKMSLVKPGSHCPKCGHKIRWRHNIPILGWCLLRGRCYDCHEPISTRYPWVEFVAGLGFAIPGMPLAWAFLKRVPEPETLVLLANYGRDVVMFLTFLAVGLIQRDGFRVPLRLFVPYFVLFAALFTTAGTLNFWGVPAAIFLYFLMSYRDRANRIPAALCALMAMLLEMGVILMYVSVVISGIHFLLIRKRAEFTNDGAAAFSLLIVPLFRMILCIAMLMAVIFVRLCRFQC